MNVISKSFDETKNSFNKRIFFLFSVTVLALCLVYLRLIDLQILNGSFYQSLAQNQHGSESAILPQRGEIYLTSVKGESLLVAANIAKPFVYAVPKEINDVDQTASKLGRLLEIKPADLAQKIREGSQNYLVLTKQLTEEVGNAIKALGLEGIRVEQETIRFYPEQNLASHSLGFLGFKGDKRIGQYGIEGRFEKNLSGSPGVVGLESDVAGRWITFASRNLIPAQDGDDIYLTIDPAIQFKAEEVLNTSVSVHGAESGSVVVLNPKTGAILALAISPSFDPNEYNKVSDISVYANKALAADYEPGSIFKPITMAASLNEGRVTPQTTYEDTGVVEFPENLRIKNSDNEAHGIQTMTQVLENSLNTGAVFAEQQLGHESFKEYVKKFGFGSLTGLELPGEVLGNIDNLNKKGDIFFATASFGQGITVTPIQVAAAFAAIANGGKLMKPHVVSKIVHPDETEEQFYPEEKARVIEPKIASQLSAMMVSVVENGHGKRAGVKGYYIAGKTGTAQVAYKDRAGYDPGKNIGSFVGFGPVDDPVFVMLVRIDHPKDVKFAESTAAPAFGEIAQFILSYMQIPPSRQ